MKAAHKPVAPAWARFKAGVRRVAPLIWTIRALRARASPMAWSIWRLETFARGRLMQSSTLTTFDRHPPMFGFIAQALSAIPAPRVLSYGCSTGEEVFALARYLPGAQLRGVDINAHCIRVARRTLARAPDPQIAFAVADSPWDEPAEAYDAVLCLSVLRHGRLEAERPQTSTAIVPFARFADMAAGLDHCLKPGGYLAIWGAHFSFADTPTAARYAVAYEAESKVMAPSPLYGPDDRRQPRPLRDAYVFRKLRSGGGGAEP